MRKLTNIVNNILGAGTNRRVTPKAALKVESAPVWSVRQKFDPKRRRDS